MSRTAVGRAAADLPWLCPNTTGLVGLAEAPADLPALAAADPALLAFLARFAADPDGAPGPFTPHRLYSAALPDAAASFLAHSPAGWLDPAADVAADVRAVSARAGVLARRAGGVDADAAEIAARLAPLGWLAVAAVNSRAAVACLRDPAFAADPVRCQRAHWGLDHAAVARRLAARWRFPRWLAGVLGSLARPHTPLAAAVAQVVADAQRDTLDLGLTPGIASTHCEKEDSEESPGTQVPGPMDENPHRVPLLRSLLRRAAEGRRRSAPALVLRLEQDVDDLHARLAAAADAAGAALTAAKLAALAEFAAGAGHEINNPLAVISGHAQRLLRTEPDEERADSLRTVVRQTQRIAGILKEVMQFARPPRPDRGRVLVSDLFAGVRSDQEPFAGERGVRIEVSNADAVIDADPKQLRQAVGAVVRNGIEAAGRGGWVRLGCDPVGVKLVVEDGGPGLTADAAAHAFDPFFCGRPAGRGRGLGLPFAWRLARENGGDLRHDPAATPTRFVFTFPPAAALRQSA